MKNSESAGTGRESLQEGSTGYKRGGEHRREGRKVQERDEED